MPDQYATYFEVLVPGIHLLFICRVGIFMLWICTMPFKPVKKKMFVSRVESLRSISTCFTHVGLSLTWDLYDLLREINNLQQ